MKPDPQQPARLKLHEDPVTPPQDWSGAVEYPTLAQAVEAAVDALGDGPWIQSAGQILSPAEIGDLWKELFRARSD